MRLLILFILLLCSWFVNGQIVRTHPYYKPFAASGCTPDADAQKFIDSTGITDQTQKDAICTLVRELKDSSLWSSMSAIYPLIGGTASSHKWNLKNPQNTNAAFRLTFSGTWTHSSSGADPNGTDAFANTYYSATGNGSFSDYAISVYLTENTTVGLYPIDMGASNFGSNLSIDVSINRPNESNKSVSASGNYITSGTVLQSASANTTAGYILSTRRGLSDFEIYKNGSSLASTTTAASSISLNVNYYLGATNSIGTTFNYSNRNIAFATVGAGLTDDQVRALNTIVEKFNDALGRGVQ